MVSISFLHRKGKVSRTSFLCKFRAHSLHVKENCYANLSACTVRKLSRTSFLCKLNFAHTACTVRKLSRTSFLCKISSTQPAQQGNCQANLARVNFENTACTVRKLARTSIFCVNLSTQPACTARKLSRKSLLCKSRAHSLHGKEIVTQIFLV